MKIMNFPKMLLLPGVAGVNNRPALEEVLVLPKSGKDRKLYRASDGKGERWNELDEKTVAIGRVVNLDTRIWKCFLHRQQSFESL